jgi:hypothetical protein
MSFEMKTVRAQSCRTGKMLKGMYACCNLKFTKIILLPTEIPKLLLNGVNILIDYDCVPHLTVSKHLGLN